MCHSGDGSTGGWYFLSSEVLVSQMVLSTCLWRQKQQKRQKIGQLDGITLSLYFFYELFTVCLKIGVGSTFKEFRYNFETKTQKTVHLCIIPSALALLWLLPQLSVFLLSSGPDIYVPEDHKLEWKAYIETIQILLIMRKNYF